MARDSKEAVRFFGEILCPTCAKPITLVRSGFPLGRALVLPHFSRNERGVTGGCVSNGIEIPDPDYLV